MTAVGMNAEQLLTHFDRIANAPDTVSHLRCFILDLAVRGRLVSQDPNDESASELLKRVAAEKARLVKAGEIKESRAKQTYIADAPFEVPQQWKWAALGELFLYDAGVKREPQALNPELWLLELEDLEKDTGQLLVRIKASERESKSTKSEFRVGDILYGKLRPYLNKVLVADEPGYSTTEIVALRSYLQMCPQYCSMALRCPYFAAYVTRLGQGTKMPRLRTEDAAIAPFPLPPLAEQYRIAAKVDELMALCDRLEAVQMEREIARNRLAAASLAPLNTPDPDPAIFQNHAAFALDNFTPLTIRPGQIKALRQTIVNLAVRGKLVPQDPTDEPASELLKRIAAEKARLVKEGEIKKQKPIAPALEADQMFDLPPGWSPTRLAIIAVCLDYMRRPISETERTLRIAAKPQSKLVPYYGATQQQGWIDDYIFDGELILLGEDGVPFLDPLRQKAYLIKGKSWVNNHAHVFRGIFVSPSYLVHWLNVYDYSGRVVGATRAKLNQARAVDIPIMLPPLAEQHRIVAKVDELMALCNQVEADLTIGDNTRHRLLDALLHEALEPNGKYYECKRA